MKIERAAIESVTAAYDYPLIGYNVRCSRMARNKTQAEVARLASVGRSTVRRLEAGDRVHPHSVKKICDALGRPISVINSLMPYGTPDQRRAFHIHRAEDLFWFAHNDARRGIPKDNRTLLQSEAERVRLARLGLVSMFEAYAVTMPYGPSISYAEISSVVSLSPHETYRTCILVGLRGETIFRIGTEALRIGERDSVGFDTDDSATVEPATSIESHDSPPLLLFIMGNRRGHVPIEYQDVTRKRIRR